MRRDDGDEYRSNALMAGINTFLCTVCDARKKERKAFDVVFNIAQLVSNQSQRAVFYPF